MTKDELGTFIDERLESGDWDLPVGPTVEEYVKEQVEHFFKELPELEGVKPGELEHGTGEQKTETPIQDMARYSLAAKDGNHKILDDMREKDHVIGTTTAGGHLVPTEYTNQLIDLVYKDSNVMGYCKRIPMKTNVMVIPTRTAGLGGYTIAESSDAAGGSTPTTETTTTFATVTLTAYKHGIVTYISNELLEDADPAIEALIREDIVRQLASYVDWGIFHGNNTAGLDGANSLISGLEGNNVITSNIFNAGGAPSFDDILSLQTPEDNTNAPIMMFMAPAARRALAGVKDNNGQYIYDPTVRDGSVPAIWGMPVVTNNRISKTLGGGAETMIVSGAFGESAILGIKNSINFVLDPFTYSNSATTRISAHFRIAFTVAAENHFALLGGVTT